MTDIDLDAIRARAEAVKSARARMSSGQPMGLIAYGAIQSSAADVPALLARLAEVEAERDAARQYADSCTCGAWMNPSGLTVWAERDTLAAENARLRQGADDWARAHGYYVLRRDLEIALAAAEHMRPVVEAAEAWRDVVKDICFVGFAELYVAVDAYRAAQQAPETAPEPRQGDEQAEPVVASTDTAQAQRGVPSFGDHFRALVKTPADPPGLDAAIEAAALATSRHHIDAATTDADVYAVRSNDPELWATTEPIRPRRKRWWRR